MFGVQGILGAYRQCLDRVYLNGPTLFSQIIRTAVEVSSRPWDAETQYYHILLIITDGAIHDMNETKELVVTASNYPLSIIIVGVGNADFSAMETLDSDDKLLRDHKGRTASRDIVQFVPFKKYQGNPYMLAKEVLAEVPAQLTGYMKQHNLAPMPRKEIRFSQLNIPAPITTDNPQNFNLTVPMIQGFGAQFTGLINKPEESKVPSLPTQDYTQPQFQSPPSYQPGQMPPVANYSAQPSVGPSQYAYVQPSYNAQPGLLGHFTPEGQPPIPNEALTPGFMGLLHRSQGNQQNQASAPPSAPSAPSE